jgi:hypothetical protein
MLRLRLRQALARFFRASIPKPAIPDNISHAAPGIGIWGGVPVS